MRHDLHRILQADGASFRYRFQTLFGGLGPVDLNRECRVQVRAKSSTRPPTPPHRARRVESAAEL